MDTLSYVYVLCTVRYANVKIYTNPTTCAKSDPFYANYYLVIVANIIPCSLKIIGKIQHVSGTPYKKKDVRYYTASIPQAISRYKAFVTSRGQLTSEMHILMIR